MTVQLASVDVVTLTAALMTILSALLPVAPTLSVAVMVKLNVPVALGVPVIAPVEVLRDSPVGKLPALTEKVRAWQADVVAPLRSLRRRLKSDPPLLDKGSAELFRTKIKAIELEAERLQQEAMFALADTLRAEPANSVEEAARDNIAAYQAAIGRPLDAAAVDTLVDALRRRMSGETT